MSKNRWYDQHRSAARSPGCCSDQKQILQSLIQPDARAQSGDYRGTREGMVRSDSPASPPTNKQSLLNFAVSWRGKRRVSDRLFLSRLAWGTASCLLFCMACVSFPFHLDTHPLQKGGRIGTQNRKKKNSSSSSRSKYNPPSLVEITWMPVPETSRDLKMVVCFVKDGQFRRDRPSAYLSQVAKSPAGRPTVASEIAGKVQRNN